MSNKAESDPEGHRIPPPAYSKTENVVTIQEVPIVLGPEPMNIVCPSCKNSIITEVKVKPNNKTHMMAMLLCIIGGLLCVWIPYCCNSCMSKKHYCPHCNAYLGQYSD